MSSSRERQGPSPPTAEQVLEDLSSASDQDVVFMKSPLSSEFTTAGSDSSNQGDSMHDTLDGEEKTDSKGKLEQQRTERKSNEELYTKVSSFLEQFKSLEAGKEELKGSEEDLKSTKEGLEDAIRKVEQVWKVDKKD